MKLPVPPLRVLCVLVMASCAAPAYALNFNDGSWHVTVDTEVKGMKVRPPPTYYYTRCFTKDSFQPSLAPAGSPCRAVDVKTKDDVMTWTLSCSRDMGQMQGGGRMVFSGNQVRGVMTTQSQYPEPMQVIQKITAKRVGACDMGGKKPLEGKTPLRQPMPDYQP